MSSITIWNLPFLIIFWTFKIPWYFIVLIFKLKIRHAFVILYMITVFISALYTGIVQKSMPIFLIEVIRPVIASENTISNAINNLVLLEQIKMQNIIWFILVVIGSLYFLYYLYYITHWFVERFLNADVTVIQTLFFLIPLLFLGKILFFGIEAELLGASFSLLDMEVWVNSLPFKFVWDIIKNIPVLLEKTNILTTSIQNMTEPYVYQNGT